MALFKGPMRRHINGRKELTDSKEILAGPTSDVIYIPLFAMHSEQFDVLVNEGDYVSVGTKLAQCNDRMIVPIYSSVSGTVKGVQKMMSGGLKPINHILIESDKKFNEIQAFPTLEVATASADEIKNFMKEAGIVGCGGACFPTYIKYGNTADIHTVLINAVECEPFITSDYKMMVEDMKAMFDGALAMQKAADAKTVKIALKKTKVALIKQMQEAAKEYAGFEIVAVPDLYPMGWERTLIQQIFKKDYNRLPGEIGVVVNNATTAMKLAKAMSMGQPIVEKIITVSGDGIKNPQNVRVRVGTPVSELVALCGGYASDNVLVIAGGPMMGKTIPNDKFVVDRATNAITILKFKKETPLACLRCGKCTDGCPAAIQPVRIATALKANDMDALSRMEVMNCIECGLCTYVCPSKIDVTEKVRTAKRVMMARAK